MSDTRHHRGRHPEDDRLFAPAQAPRLQQSVSDLSWLLTRHYALPSALKLVGDRYGLEQRQRLAVARAACSDTARISRQSRRVDATALHGASLAIDGFNVLLTIEAALSGGILLRCRDGCLRDMASVHGTYRQVRETLPAAEMTADCLLVLGLANCVWYLDAPVSNSGRLAQLLREVFATRNLVWDVQLVNSPDQQLRQSTSVVATADSAILDACAAWFDLTRHVLAAHPAPGQVIELAE
jgi:hypothetical protein